MECNAIERLESGLLDFLLIVIAIVYTSTSSSMRILTQFFLCHAYHSLDRGLSLGSHSNLLSVFLSFFPFAHGFL